MLYFILYIFLGLITTLFYRMNDYEENLIDYNQRILPNKRKKIAIISRILVFVIWPIPFLIMVLHLILSVIFGFFKMLYLLFFD